VGSRTPPPVPIDEAVIDVQTVREVTENGVRQLEVLLAAAPEALVLTHIRTLEGASLVVDAVEVGALAMARGLGQTEAEGTHVLVTWCLHYRYRGRPRWRPAVHPDHSPRGDALTRVITQLLKADVAAAEEAKILYGLGWEEGPENLPEGAYATDVSQALAELITQVRRSLDFFRAQFTGVVISDMILCGGGSRLGTSITTLQ